MYQRKGSVIFSFIEKMSGFLTFFQPMYHWEDSLHILSRLILSVQDLVTELNTKIETISGFLSLFRIQP